MKIKLFDYADRVHEEELPIENINEIDLILVEILSGDEVVTIALKNGRVFIFDAGKDTRFISYFDGFYVVTGARIKEWLEFIKTPNTYERQRYFDGEGTENDTDI